MFAVIGPIAVVDQMSVGFGGSRLTANRSHMPELSYDQLRAACEPGGASVLTSVTELAPAGGAHCAIAPARYASGSQSVYAYEDRFVDGELRHTVLIDSKSSQLNRIEIPLSESADDGHPVLSQLPRIRVTYTIDGRQETFTDLQLPHRAFDAHIRVGTVNGTPVTSYPPYVAARNATTADASALLNLSPVSLLLGAWDSSRRTRQGRYPSALVGEIIGVLADQASVTPRPAKHSGARVDPVAASVQLPGKTLVGLADQQGDEISAKLRTKIAKDAKSAAASGSVLGLGAIPPGVEDIAGIATRRIIRSHVLSFATLRQLRFGKGTAGDASLRALLAAVALNGLARSDSELLLRANCHLVEAGPAAVVLDGRYGSLTELGPISIEVGDEVLADAFAAATSEADLGWNGQILEVVGNPEVLAGAADETPEQ